MTRRTRIYLTLTAAAALAVLFWLFPLTGDDWYREGLGRTMRSLGDLARELISRWKTTNPRIFGNMLAYLSGSRPVLRWLLRTALTLLLFCFASKAAGVQSGAGFVLLTVGVFALPREMFRQIYPWSAGFFNYLPPVAALLAVFWLLEDGFEEKHESPGRCAAVGLLAFSAQLFVENDTIYAVCAGIFLLLWCRKAQKRWSPGALCFLLGAILGAALLFASPSYRTVTQAGTAYQMTGGLSGLCATARENSPEILSWMLTDCPVLYIGLTLAALTLALRTRKKTDLVPVAGMAAAAVWSAAKLPGQGAAAAVWLAALGFLVLRSLDGVRRRRAAFFLLSALTAAAPLAVVTPIGPRCLFLSYVFLLLTGMQLLHAAGWSGAVVWQKAAAGVAALAVFAAACICFCPSMRRSRCAGRRSPPQWPRAERRSSCPTFRTRNISGTRTRRSSAAPIFMKRRGTSHSFSCRRRSGSREKPQAFSLPLRVFCGREPCVCGGVCFSCPQRAVSH